jgi:hypothetical protein
MIHTLLLDKGGTLRENEPSARAAYLAKGRRYFAPHRDTKTPCRP